MDGAGHHDGGAAHRRVSASAWPLAGSMSRRLRILLHVELPDGRGRAHAIGAGCGARARVRFVHHGGRFGWQPLTLAGWRAGEAHGRHRIGGKQLSSALLGAGGAGTAVAGRLGMLARTSETRTPRDARRHAQPAAARWPIVNHQSQIKDPLNLPNYFLADLPPEATLSPAMLTEACFTLKRNREQYLA